MNIDSMSAHRTCDRSLLSQRRLTRIFTLWLLVGVSWSSFAADYQKCADFLHPVTDQQMADRLQKAKDDGVLKAGYDPGKHDRRYSYWQTGGFMFDRLYYFPFKVKEDGEIVCNPDDLNGVECAVERMDHATVHTIHFPIPSLGELEASSRTSILGKEDRPTKATFKITRTATGLEILEDLNLTVRERAEAMGAHENRQFVAGKTRLLFALEEGECVPKESAQFLMHREDPNRQAKIVTFDMPLCRNVKAFIDSSPGATVVFDADVNKAMMEVFHRQGKRFFHEDDEFLSFDEREDRAQAMQWGSEKELSDPKQLSFLAVYAGSRWSEHIQAMAGFSPLIAGHAALANCHDQGLGDFLD